MFLFIFFWVKRLYHRGFGTGSHYFGQIYSFKIFTGCKRPATTNGHGFCRGWKMLHLLDAALFILLFWQLFINIKDIFILFNISNINDFSLLSNLSYRSPAPNLYQSPSKFFKYVIVNSFSSLSILNFGSSISLSVNLP